MPAKKPDGRRVRDKRAPQISIVPATSIEPAPPAAKRTWLADTKRQWNDFWLSDIAGQIVPTDRPALERLFDWRDELDRSRRSIRTLQQKALKDTLVEGSQGQPVKNPIFSVLSTAVQEALAIETRIVALEDRLALSPKARLTIGVTQQKGQSLAMQNAQIARAITEAMNDTPDPRTTSRKPSKKTG